MRVLRCKDFLDLPAGTLYCKGAEWHFGDMQVKGETFDNDWFTRTLNWPLAQDTGEAINKLETSLNGGSGFSLEDAESRDGCFDPDALFLVYEEKDLRELKEVIDRAVHVISVPKGYGK